MSMSTHPVSLQLLTKTEVILNGTQKKVPYKILLHPKCSAIEPKLCWRTAVVILLLELYKRTHTIYAHNFIKKKKIGLNLRICG